MTRRFPSIDLPTRVPELALAAKAWLAGRGKPADVRHFAEQFGATVRVQSALKAFPLTTSPSSPGGGSELVDNQAIADAFITTLRPLGAFDGMLPDMLQLVVQTRIIAAVIGPEGGSPGEGEEKVISSLELDDAQVRLRKAASAIVVSDELARLAGQGGVDFLNTELKGAVAGQTDIVFIAAVTADAPTIAATGTDAESFRSDLATALALLGLGATSKPYILLAPARALALSMMTAPAGGAEFPDLGPQGGSISSVPALVSDALSGEGSDTVAVADAAGLAADPGTVLLQPAVHASVNLGGAVVNLWQNNLTALRAERWFGAEKARANAIATITGAAYGSSGDTSP